MTTVGTSPRGRSPHPYRCLRGDKHCIRSHSSCFFTKLLNGVFDVKSCACICLNSAHDFVGAVYILGVQYFHLVTLWFGIEPLYTITDRFGVHAPRGEQCQKGKY